MTVGDGCKLKLGSTGDTISTTGGTGVYDFNTLVVKAGGEVTMTDDLTNMNNKITITVRSLYIVSYIDACLQVYFSTGLLYFSNYIQLHTCIILIELMYIVFLTFDWTRALSLFLFFIRS